MVRFSSTRDAIEVAYHRLPIHPTVPEDVANVVAAKRLYQARWVSMMFILIPVNVNSAPHHAIPL